MIGDPAVRVVILDLAAVTAVASDAVGVLVGLLVRGRKRGADLVLVSLRPLVAEVFHLCQLLTDAPDGSAFRTHPDVAAALAAVRPTA